MWQQGSVSTSDLSVKSAASVGVTFSGVQLTGFSVVFNNALGPSLPHSLIFKFWPTFDLWGLTLKLVPNTWGLFAVFPCFPSDFLAGLLFSLLILLTEKNTQPGSWELCFIWRLYWGLWPGRKLLSYENLFQRDKQGARIYRSFCWKKTKHNKTM